MKVVSTEIAGETLYLHPFRGVFWERESCLLLADLHVGKIRHFRKAGIPVPLAAGDADLDRLLALLLDFRPRRVLFLGDLFHSEHNREWESFRALIRQFDGVSFELVRGNHDILTEANYEEAGLTVYDQTLQEEPFLFSHHPLDIVPEGRYNLAGHVHPGVKLRGPARQWLRLPCFYFGRKQGLLPAFGTFTGCSTIFPAEGDQVFVVGEEGIFKVG